MTTLADLRSLLAVRFPEAVQNCFLSPSPRQNTVEMLPGKLVEVVADSLSGGAGVLLRRFCENASGVLALVDGADALDPAMLSAAARQRLLWVRCGHATAAIRAADLLLRDGNLSTVLLDLRLLPERELLRLPSSVWHRLRMLAERANAAVGIFSPCRSVPCAARRWVVAESFGLEALAESSDLLADRLHPHAQERLNPPDATLAIAS